MSPIDARAIPVVDTGLRSAIDNNAMDRDGLRRVARGEGADHLRFYRSRQAASIGRYQAAEREIRLEYCARRGIQVMRRPTGGGALYLDPDCLQFTLILRRPAAWRAFGVRALLERAGSAVAEGLRQLGIEARFKSPNDLEVGGRKIASVFGVCEGPAVMLQGTVLLNADIRSMLETLRVPTEKLSPDGLSAARDRLATVKECLGEIPAMEAVRAALERGLATVLGIQLRRDQKNERRYGPAAGKGNGASEPGESAGWVGDEEGEYEAVWKGQGATVRARADFLENGARFRRVKLAGDLHIDPPERLTALAQALSGLPVGLVPRFVDSFFREHPADMVGFGPGDLVRVLQLTAEKSAATRVLGLDRSEANALMVFGSAEEGGVREILERVRVMLVPYCAKPAWCKWRHLDGCAECGMCEVGEAYQLARERGMQVTTITRYEHLVETLAEMKQRRVPAYLGMCCSNFFIKRHRAFRDAGMPAVLMDVSGANCYELRQEDQAYAGTFSAEARIDAVALRKLMRVVPGAAGREAPDGGTREDRGGGGA